MRKVLCQKGRDQVEFAYTRTEHLAENAGKRFRVPKFIILIDDFIVPCLVFLQLNGLSSPRTELRVLERDARARKSIVRYCMESKIGTERS
jgi:hypothetical protein